VKKRTLINEDRFPYIIEIAVPPGGLDAQTSRSIVDFHAYSGLGSVTASKICPAGAFRTPLQPKPLKSNSAEII
jgi:hypothetical protein